MTDGLSLASVVVLAFTGIVAATAVHLLFARHDLRAYQASHLRAVLALWPPSLLGYLTSGVLAVGSPSTACAASESRRVSTAVRTLRHLKAAGSTAK